MTRHLDRKTTAEWNEQTGDKRPSTANSSRIMFYDFSSAFNTIQPHLLGRKLGRAGHDDLLDIGQFDFPLTVRAAW